MAVVENKASEIGDIILIRAEVPIIGLITLASYVDSVVNSTEDRFFTKEFRYAVDGLNFSPWVSLTNENIAAVEVQPKDVFLIEYRYTRQGTDATGELEFNEVEITGTYTDSVCGENYKKSIFSQFFSCTDVQVLSWMINVLEKLYKKGILPNYIERGEQNNEFNQDQDFLEFWKSITQYFAYIVIYARQWELSKATSNPDILIEYLQNQTFIFTGGETVQELTHIMNNTYDESRKRGTSEIIKTKESDGTTIDGEWHRLFNNISAGTDWYFSYVFNYKMGWVGDVASPLYRGTYFDRNMIKGFESTREVMDIEVYPNSDAGSIVTDTDNQGVDVDVLNFTVQNEQSSGIVQLNNPADKSELIRVATNAEYEVTFWVKGGGSLTFGVDTFDENGNKVVQGTSGVFYNNILSNFFTDLVLPRSDRYYFVRGIIFSRDHKVKEGELYQGYIPNIATINIPEGAGKPAWVNNQTQQYDTYISGIIRGMSNNASHLKFRHNSVSYICPKIMMYNGEVLDSNLRVYDVKVRPVRTYYSTGLVQGSNFIKMQVKNSNLNYTNKDAEEVMREYLIPYKSTFKTEFLNPPVATNVGHVTDIITDSSKIYTSPTGSGVNIGDRYFLYDNGEMNIISYNVIDIGGMFITGWQLKDNEQGNIAYIVNKRTVYSYDDGVWKFKAN